MLCMHVSILFAVYRV